MTEEMENTQESSDETQNTESTPGPVPYDRFKAVNAELAALKRRVKETEGVAAKLAEAEGLVTSQTTRLTELEEALGAIVAKERQVLSPAIAELLDALDLTKQLEWLANHKDELAKGNGRLAPVPKGTETDNTKSRENKAYTPYGL